VSQAAPARFRKVRCATGFLRGKTVVYSEKFYRKTPKFRKKFVLTLFRKPSIQAAKPEDAAPPAAHGGAPAQFKVFKLCFGEVDREKVVCKQKAAECLEFSQ